MLKRQIIFTSIYVETVQETERWQVDQPKNHKCVSSQFPQTVHYSNKKKKPF